VINIFGDFGECFFGKKSRELYKPVFRKRQKLDRFKTSKKLLQETANLLKFLMCIRQACHLKRPVLKKASS
jgi:hypothetical protein